MVEVMPPLRSSGFVDPGWEHGVAQDEKKKKVKCNYCGKIVSGGVYRLKQHLARVSGEVTYCDKAPEDVYLRMKQNLDTSRFSKKAKQAEEEIRACLNSQYEDEDAHAGYRNKGKQLMGDRDLMVNMTPVQSLGVDPGWEHGVAQDERKKKVKCNYCEKVVSGGINRFKQHLARIPGEVAPCKSAPEEVFLRMKENMKWHRSGKRQRMLDTKQISSFTNQFDNEDEEDEQEQSAPLHMSKEREITSNKKLGKDLRMTSKAMVAPSGFEPLLKRSKLDSVCMNMPTRQTSPLCKKVKVQAESSRKSRKEVLSAICKFFYHAGVPLQAADSIYFHKMLELVSQYGHGLVGPRSHIKLGHFLQEEIASIKNNLVRQKASWAITGCSIMADSWTDIEGRTLINLLVSCPHGVYFVASVDGSEMVHDALSLFKLLDRVVEEMGEENVVQVITQNTSSYKAAGKMLEEKRQNLFWTPCATYCIDRMLEDLLKIKSIGECVAKGQKITRLIYNHIWLRNLMKEHTQGQEILRAASTKYSSSFATLQGLLDHRSSLKRMLQSSQWISSRFSKSDKGKEVEKIVSNATFWKKVQNVCKLMEPLLQVLLKINSENLPMPYLYNDMYRAKLAIKSICGDRPRKYEPFWSVLDNHMNSLLSHPLYLAAYFLNPSYRYRSDFLMLPEVMRGLNYCILRLEPDNMRRIAASKHISDYNSAKGDFGTELAISTRTEIEPAAWWQQHGINYKELQQIAVHILSQTCTSSGCEHSWSIYDQIHSQRQNHLAQKRLNDLVFVHYNLRLRECQLRKRSNGLMSLNRILSEHLLDDWIAEEEKHTLQDDEEIVYKENEAIHEDGCKNDLVNYRNITMQVQKGKYELVSMADAEQLDHGSAGGGLTDDGEDEEDENFFDNDLSD